jgi:hypothetical protein
MRQRTPSQLAQRCRRVRSLLASWRRRDPKAWVVALVGMALGIGVFLLMLAELGVLRLVAYVVQLLR